MSMPRSEIKWAAGGFIGGFLLCYILLAAAQAQRPASPRLARVTLPVAWPPVPLTAVQLTNMALPELRSEASPQRLGPGPAPHPGYSLDLIDTHAKPPKLPESQ